MSLIYECLHNDDLIEIARPVRGTVYVKINTVSKDARERDALLRRITATEKRRN